MMNGGRKIRILIADDHPVLRRGLRALIEEEPDMEVVGEAGNGLEAVQTNATSFPSSKRGPPDTFARLLRMRS